MGYGPNASDSATPTQAPPSGLPEVTAPPSSEELISSQGVNGEAASSTPGQGESGSGQGAEGGGEPQPGEVSPGDGGEPSPLPWLEAQDVGQVLAIEAVASEVKTREETARRNGQSETEKRMRPTIQQTQETYAGIQDQMRQFGLSWNKLIRDGTVSQEAVEQLFESHGGTFAALVGVQQDMGIWKGITQVIERTFDHLGDSGAKADFTQRVERLRRNMVDESFTEDFVDRVREAAAAPVREQLKEANATIARLEEDAKRDGRTSQPAPANISGRGGRSAMDNSDTARLDRLAYGKDAQGNLATDEDRQWIAERGN